MATCAAPSSRPPPCAALPARPSLWFLLRGRRESTWSLPTPFSPIPSPLGLSTMASASRALLLSRASPLHVAASRFLRPLAAAGSLLPATLVPSPAAARRFVTQPANSTLRDPSR
ncbi:hypothetical protein D1007_54935 [Hordeum vulgare]|nr:hypothetical protein D1007_54935 [Hordeum vulgare]